MRGMTSVTCCLALIAALSTSSLGKVGFRQVTSTHPVAVQRGTTAEVKLRSNFTLDETYRTFIVPGGIDLKFLETKPIEAHEDRGGKTYYALVITKRVTLGDLLHVPVLRAKQPLIGKGKGRGRKRS